MNNLILAIVSLIPGAMNIETGILSQYAQSPTDGTLAYRQEVGQIPYDLAPNTVLLAVADCDMIGQWGLISIDGREWESAIAFDCVGHTSTADWMEAANVIAEIDFYTAERYDLICLCPIEGRIVWLN